MNRRSFFTKLGIGLASGPALVKAMVHAPREVAATEVEWAYGHYHADSRGIHRLLQDCGKVVDHAPLDLDYIFEQVYKIRRHRDAQPPLVLVRRGDQKHVQRLLDSMRRANWGR
jgi:hypothetical protein